MPNEGNELSSWVKELAKTAFSERGAFLDSLVLGELRKALMMQDHEPFPLDQSYFELGLTSLGAVEIRHRLEARLGRAIDSAGLFNNPTTKHLLSYLRERVLSEFFVAPASALKRGEPLSAATPTEQVSAQRDERVPARLLSDVLDDLYDS